MISIVVPLYNKEKVVTKTLESVLRQTYTKYELLIVNDGSTDGSEKKVIDFIREKNLSCWPIRIINQANGGVSAARNLGVQEATGDYIAFLDADDEWEHDYLKEMNTLIENYPECDVFASSYAFKEGINKNSVRLKNIKFSGQDGILDNYFQVASSGQPPLWTSAVIVTKKALLSVGGFPIGIKIGQDIITWAKLACQYKIAFTKKVLAYYIRDKEAYETVGKNYQYIVGASDDVGGKTLRDLVETFRIPGLRKYLYLWHKMRFVMFVASSRRKDAFIEWLLTFPYGLFNLDCYYRLFLNIFSQRLQNRIKNIVGK